MSQCQSLPSAHLEFLVKKKFERFQSLPYDFAGSSAIPMEKAELPRLSFPPIL